MSDMTGDYPSHLRPVPDHGGSAAPALGAPEEQGTPGLTPPLQRGHSRGFITDVLVELGYVAEPTVRAAVENAVTAKNANAIAQKPARRDRRGSSWCCSGSGYSLSAPASA